MNDNEEEYSEMDKALLRDGYWINPALLDRINAQEFELPEVEVGRIEDPYYNVPEHLKPTKELEAKLNAQKWREEGPQLRDGQVEGTVPWEYIPQSEKDDILADFVTTFMPYGKIPQTTYSGSSKLMNYGKNVAKLKPTKRLSEHIKRGGEYTKTANGNPTYTHYSREVVDNRYPPYAYRLRDDKGINRTFNQGWDSNGNPTGPNFEDMISSSGYKPRPNANTDKVTNEHLKYYIETGNLPEGLTRNQIEKLFDLRRQVERRGRTVNRNYLASHLNSKSPTGKRKDLPENEMDY